MESIERMVAPAQLDVDGSDSYIVTMRDFLDRPRIARDFQDLKADAQRLDSIGRECDQLNARAAEADLEAGKIERAHDERRHQRLGFRVGVLLAGFLIALDALPANLAAQAFGLDVVPTWGITAVIVGALAAGMWSVTHYRSGPGRAVTIGALAVGLAAIGALRYWFLWVTAGDTLGAVLEAVALTVFTTMMVWLGVLVLSFTKSRQVSAAERRARSLRRQADRKAVQEKELARKLEAGRAEFLADAQLFSFRIFHNDGRRNQFLDYVRAELTR